MVRSSTFLAAFRSNMSRFEKYGCFSSSPMRLYDQRTSSAVSGLPSENVMPSLSLTCQTVASPLPSMDSASVFSICRSAVVCDSRSKMLSARAWSGALTMACGSRDSVTPPPETASRSVPPVLGASPAAVVSAAAVDSVGAGSETLVEPAADVAGASLDAAAAVVSGAALLAGGVEAAELEPSSSESPHAAAMAGSESAAPATRLRSRSLRRLSGPGRSSSSVAGRWPAFDRSSITLLLAPPSPDILISFKYPDAAESRCAIRAVSNAFAACGTALEQALSDVQLER